MSLIKLFTTNKKNKKILIYLGLFCVILILSLFFIQKNWSRIIAKKEVYKTNKYIEVMNTKNPVNSGEPIDISSSTDTKLVRAVTAAQELKGHIITVPILMYHYVESPSATTTLKGLYLEPKIFESQLEALKENNYQTLFVSDVAASLRAGENVDAKSVVLSFDDGYEDFYTKAFPLLKKYNYKATLYVIINALGTPGYLTRDQVRELASSGLVEIGSHTFNHPDLRSKKTKDAKFEIEESKKTLEQISGIPVETFAYPFGFFKESFFALETEAGYTAAVSVIPGAKHSIGNIWALRRIRPDNRQGEVFIKWLENWSQAKY